MDKDIKRRDIAQPIITCFSSLEDPRVIGRTKHKLVDIIEFDLAFCSPANENPVRLLRQLLEFP